jgi:hypothetical protein
MDRSTFCMKRAILIIISKSHQNSLLPFFIEMLQYNWLWSGHMIIKEMFYISIKLKPELARASMTTSDVNNQWRSNFHFLLCTLTPEVQCRLVHRNHVIWRTKIAKFWRNENDSKQYHETKTICLYIFLISDIYWGTEHQYVFSRFLGVSILQLLII